MAAMSALVTGNGVVPATTMLCTLRVSSNPRSRVLGVSSRVVGMRTRIADDDLGGEVMMCLVNKRSTWRA